MKKFRVFFSFEKEEAWLNEMALKGWKFIGRSLVGIGYQFEKIESQALNIRIDYRNFAFTSEYLKYLQLFADSGWQHIYGSNYGNKYFITTREDATEDLFSDHASKVGRYRRLCRASVILFLVILPFVISLYGDFITRWLTYLHMLLQVPGLWGYFGPVLYCLLSLTDLAFLCFFLHFAIRAYLAGKQVHRKKA
jgi:hypothetical protein